MTASFRPTRALLAAALALASAPALADGPYSQTVFFGDSLTDAGFFRPLLPAAVRPVTGQFTTNPDFVWSQYLADYYGTGAAPNGNGQTGTNYAAGGARVGVSTSGALGPILSLAAQVNTYLTANGGQADADALYTVWGGANDLFTITNAGGNPATVIPAAVAAQIGIVGTLTNAGARYILVPTVPDLGVTPAFRAQGATAQAQGTALTTAYNNALFSGLASNNLRVIPLDTFHLLQEIIASPATYGFGNVTGTACQPQITANSLTCNPSSYVSPDAPDTYAFADGVHPTGAAHAILAQYAISVLEGPRQIAVLPHSEVAVGRGRADRVAEHLHGKPDGDGMRWWADVRGDFQRYGHGDHYDGAGPSLTGGVDWTRGDFVFGGFAGYGRQGMDWGHRGGSFDQSDASLGGFAGWYGDGPWVNAQLSYTWLDFDIDRDVVLGPAVRRHSGSADGSNLTAAIGAGWEFEHGKLTHGPVVSVLSQHIDVDGFAESQPDLSTSLAYPDQGYDSLIGSIGWQASYAIHDHLRPYVRVTADHEFEDTAEEVFAQSQSLPSTLPYAVPGLHYDHSYATVQFGVRSEVFGLDANFGASTTVAQDGGTDAQVFATFGGKF